MSEENANVSQYTQEDLTRAAERGAVLASLAVRDLSNTVDELTAEAVLVALELMFEDSAPLQQSRTVTLHEKLGAEGHDFIKSYMRRILHDPVREALAAKKAEDTDWKM